MNFNFITNIQTCSDMIRDYVPVSMIYYSHIPAAVASLLIGLLVISKSKTLAGYILFFISLFFSLWSTIDIYLWVSTNSEIYMFFWSIIVILEVLLFIFNIYLINIFTDNNDVHLWNKFIWLTLLLPILILVPTKLNISHFDIPSCMPISNWLYDNYAIPLYGLLLVWFAILIIYKIKNNSGIKRRQIILISSGSFLFLSLFFMSNFFTDYFINQEIFSTVDAYKIEMYSLFAMPIFLAILLFVIVRFKAFDIKLIGAQALVWAMVILVGSEFLFVETQTAQILTAITLILSAIVGLIIVRSVKKEIALREELEIANNNQEALIHFISHQLKGFFTKSKMIFAGILEGDFGESSAQIKGLAKDGLVSDNNAVAMIQDILGASNLKSGTTNYNFKQVDLAKLITNVALGYKEEITAKGLKFETDIPVEPIMVTADETLISQVFKNVIDNSLRYTPTGEIKISLKINPENNKKVTFAVKDTGVGLSDKDKEKLFTEGGKGDDAMKVNTNSTGYGLYIVKKIVENHHGKIWAESAGRGHGSKFCVELDLAS